MRINTPLVDAPLVENLFIMRTPDVPAGEYGAAVQAVRQMVALSNSSLKLTDWDVWRAPNYLQNGKLVPHQSAEWYVASGYNSVRRQFDTDIIMYHLLEDPYQKSLAHFDIIITSADLFSTTHRVNFALGMAVPYRAALISTFRFKETGQYKLECIAQETYHETGHVLGLPNAQRTDLVQSLGNHCPNPCAMKQGLSVPLDWVAMVKERQKSKNILCPTCLNDLRSISKLVRRGR